MLSVYAYSKADISVYMLGAPFLILPFLLDQEIIEAFEV